MVLVSNAFAPVATEADFRSRYYFAGQQLLDETRREGCVLSPEMPAFVAAMNATGPWTSVPLICVKSRGHFRSGVDEWFAAEQVFELDTVGLISPVLERLPWKGLPRPVYPLDEDIEWAPASK
jgi:hypothetical protein